MPRRHHSHDHGDLSVVVTEISPGSWKAGPKAAFRIRYAVPQRPTPVISRSLRAADLVSRAA